MKRPPAPVIIRMPRISLTAAIGVIVMLMASCHPLSDLKTPDTTMPAAYGIGARDSAIFNSSEWNVMFADSTLRTMIDRALTYNKEILVAASRLEEVRQLYGITGADYLPNIDATVRGERETKWYHDGSDSDPSPDPQVGVKVHIGWEYNLMGKLGYARRQAEAEYHTTAEDLRAVRLLIATQVASTYYKLLAQKAVLNITRNTLATREESMNKARLRFEAGLTSELVFLQAQTEYLSTQSLIPELQKEADTYRTALHILMGEFPTDSVWEIHPKLISKSAPELPAGVPSELLKRRPDLMAAAHRLEASAQAVGVAYADRFPSLQLDFTFGFWNDRFPQLFKSFYYYPLGAVTGTVFDFGRKKRIHRAAVERYEQARLQYEQDILTAFGEVKDASLNYSSAHETTISKRAFLTTAQSYLNLANMQYHAGTLSYLDVLDAQRRLFDAEIGLCNALRDEYLACIDLYKALGGGIFH